MWTSYSFGIAGAIFDAMNRTLDISMPVMLVSCGVFEFFRLTGVVSRDGEGNDSLDLPDADVDSGSDEIRFETQGQAALP
jgi:hypothetical protein